MGRVDVIYQNRRTIGSAFNKFLNIGWIIVIISVAAQLVRSRVRWRRIWPSLVLSNLTLNSFQVSKGFNAFRLFVFLFFGDCLKPLLSHMEGCGQVCMCHCRIYHRLVRRQSRQYLIWALQGRLLCSCKGLSSGLLAIRVFLADTGWGNDSLPSYPKDINQSLANP